MMAPFTGLRALVLCGVAFLFLGVKTDSRYSPAAFGSHSLRGIPLALRSMDYMGFRACTMPEAGRHGSTPLPAPSQFESGKCYVFHVPRTLPVELHKYLE